MRPTHGAAAAATASTSGPPTPPRPPRRRAPMPGVSTGPASPLLPSAAPPARGPPSPPTPRSPLPPGGGSVADRVSAARAGVARGRAPPSRRQAGRAAAASPPGSSNENGGGGGGGGAASPAADTSPRTAHSVEGCATEFVAETLLPTRQGKFRLRGYRHTADGGATHTEPCAIMTGTPEGGTAIPLRVHDACFTSEVLGSLKCDCADQLRLALDYIAGPGGPGLVIYLQQEGRGIGLANKIAAYALQEGGLDTVDANRALGLPDDAREYSSVAAILADLGVRSVRLMTNNPRKVELLRGLGVAVVGRIPCLVQAQEHNLGYLLAKAGRMSHLLGADGGGQADAAAAPPPAASAATPAAARSAPIPSLSPLASDDEEVGDDGSYSYAPAGVGGDAGGGAFGGELDGSFCFWEHGGEPLAPSAGDGGGGGAAPPAGVPEVGAAAPPAAPPAHGARLGRVSGKRLVSLPEEGGGGGA